MMKQILYLSLLFFGAISYAQEEEIIIERIDQNQADKPFVGLVVEPFDYKNSDLRNVRGVQVKQVVKGEAAYNAGLEIGDVITAINGIETPSPSLFNDAVKQLTPREEVSFTYYRGKTKETAEALVGIKNTGAMIFNADNGLNYDLLIPEHGDIDIQEFNFEEDLNLGEGFDRLFFNLPKAQLGVSIDENEKGIEIKKVSEDSAAEKADLQVGDVITEVNGEKVSSVEDLQEKIAEMDVDDEVKIAYLRNGKKKKTTAKLQEYSANNFHFFKKEKKKEDNK